jgi:hypothetical protein
MTDQWIMVSLCYYNQNGVEFEPDFKDWDDIFQKNKKWLMENVTAQESVNDLIYTSGNLVSAAEFFEEISLMKSPNPIIPEKTTTKKVSPFLCSQKITLISIIISRSTTLKTR